MLNSIDDQVIDFYQVLFDRIFADPFRGEIRERLKRNAVIRQVGESADAASQSLTRLLRNRRLTDIQAASLLARLARVTEQLTLENMANPNITPEAVVEHLVESDPGSPRSGGPELDAVYRVALHSVVQVLLRVGPVMAEWQKLNFSTTFELPRRVTDRLNQISDQINALTGMGQEAADKRYEVQYRDYLLQRFHRTEAGTVRMTTNLDVDLAELFVMPRVSVIEKPSAEIGEMTNLMDLAAARAILDPRNALSPAVVPRDEEEEGVPAVEQIKTQSRNVIIGIPGSGKSTLLEWLQVRLAAAQEELILADRQAIPLLLRVRQLDPQQLPTGSALIEKATASRDLATLMPAGWIERQMEAGRVLFMLDGLDELEPEQRDTCLIPWLTAMVDRYPTCHYLLTSRPVGYPDELLETLELSQCTLLDFTPRDVLSYAQHWCTAVRLARNEPTNEARREGHSDGDRIVAGFADHPYIHNLARNPLMLSAICLVNYFEGSQLPKDRAVLYLLCVEGLLHNWDQRRGIHSEYSLGEKLRVCREVALAMQAHDRAEYSGSDVRQIFHSVLGASPRTDALLEHIRYRTGLLLERRPGVFAFAHLTFQEYLAARAVYEGNKLGIDITEVIEHRADGQWNEVIALYCSIVPAPLVETAIRRIASLLGRDESANLLVESYLSTAIEVQEKSELRSLVLRKAAVAPLLRDPYYRTSLDRFPDDQAAQFANICVSTSPCTNSLSSAYWWLLGHEDAIDPEYLLTHFRNWRHKKPFQLGELVYLSHSLVPDVVATDILSIVDLPSIYAVRGPRFSSGSFYCCQAEVAIVALAQRVASGLPERDVTSLCLLLDLAIGVSYRVTSRMRAPDESHSGLRTADMQLPVLRAFLETNGREQLVSSLDELLHAHRVY